MTRGHGAFHVIPPYAGGGVIPQSFLDYIEEMRLMINDDRKYTIRDVVAGPGISVFTPSPNIRRVSIQGVEEGAKDDPSDESLPQPVDVLTDVTCTDSGLLKEYVTLTNVSYAAGTNARLPEPVPSSESE